MDKEWNALREVGAWDEKLVREWGDVRAEAKKMNIRMHVGMVFGICVEKGSELPEGSPGRKYKGRVVFRGSDVRDESHYLATFQDLGSAPASMSSGKFLDFLGLLPNWVLMQADAVRAYVQARLQGVPTWVRVPREQCPNSRSMVTQMPAHAGKSIVTGSSVKRASYPLPTGPVATDTRN